MYATPSDVTNRWREDVTVTGLSNDDLLQALSDASDEIDSRLAVRYTLPLPEVPAVLVRLAVDIAVYLSATDAMRMTELKEKRYQAAVKWLDRVAEGKAQLVLIASTDTDGDGDIDAEDTVNSVEITFSERLFTRSTLGNVL
jgi:phage gp36-like protein